MNSARRAFLALGSCLALASPAAKAAGGTLSDPLPEPLPSGLSAELGSWLTIPQSNSSSPKARINHLKPCPGDTRLFVNDLRGKLWAIASKNATTSSQYINLADHFPNFIHTPGLGTGFASFSFHPEFQQSGKPGFGKFYTAHSETVNGAAPDFVGPDSPDLSQIGIITEWTLSNPAAASITTSPANFTRREIMRLGFPYNFHDLQEIEFDPTANPGDQNYGCLFLCLGDGGSVVLDRPNNVGRIDSPFGCIQRITPILASGQSAANFTLSANGKYYIPSGTTNANPYVAAADPTPGDGKPVVREIYAHGLRNPHRVTWDPVTRKMLCGNIGESMVEEVELVTKGSNHGWPNREGAFFFTYQDKTHVYPLDAPETGGYAYPVSEYDHGNGRCAIIGGPVYRGSGIPALQGHYLFGDIVTGEFFVTPVASMNRAATTNTGDTPVPPKTLALKSNGTPTTFRTILGATRADLRFGTDHDGEVYVLSKQNGKIYRLLADPNVVTPPAPGTGADWQTVANFENGDLSALNVTVPGSSAQIVNDPAEGAVNRVLRIRSAGTTAIGAHLPIPPIADGTRGTVFFRFYLVDQNHDANWGVSDRTTPTSTSHYRLQMRSATGTGNVTVKDNTTLVPASDIRLKTWYSAWLQADNATGTANDRYDLYLQGGPYGVPTLVKTGVSFANGGIASALRSFYWRMLPTTEMYFDDLRVDSGHLNLSDPLAADWHLVDTFEGPAPLASWDIPNAAAQAATIVTETSGNRYLRRAASSSALANPAAIAAKRLPFDTQVSKTLTLFFRLRLEGGNLRHSFGASSKDPADPATYTEADFSPQLRLSPTGNLHLYNGTGGTNSFVAAPVPALQNNVWYKVWLVAFNGGAASGGQTWYSYIQGGLHPQPVQLGGPFHFRLQAELPLTHFLSIATTGSGIGNNALNIDDLHAFEGLNLTDPLAPEWAPATIERAAGNQITVSHAGVPNREFQLYESPDLRSWQPLGPVVEGDEAWRELTLPLQGPRHFYQSAQFSRRDFHAAEWSTTFPDPELPPGLTLLASSTWTYAPGLLTLTTTGTQVTGMPVRPCGYALVPGDWRNATLTVESHTLRPATTTARDVVLIFGYVDESHFYYAHVSSTANGTSLTHITKVDGTTAAPIQSPSVPPVKLTSNWQTLRVTHAATGAIAVFADNLTTPFMTASDTAFPVGRLGFGSQDDPAEFRKVTVTGEKP